VKPGANAIDGMGIPELSGEQLGARGMMA